ncbi:HNH endonuclease [Candidatus Poribacteria bacterium]|nr:HNH endonuclease [Candidatus Poribacteria bacterium]
MRSDERVIFRQRFQLRCGYCHVREADVGAESTVDHFQPRSRGGEDKPDNWVYCCHACNEFKGNYWQPNLPRRILHPQRDRLDDHVAERDNGTLYGLTETGTFHIQKLRLNRAGLVAYRCERRLSPAGSPSEVSQRKLKVIGNIIF